MNLTYEPVILVVEDDPSARKLIVSALRTLGRVIEASDAESALVALREHHPALVCLDLSLPDASGFALCRQIRQEASQATMAVLAVSGRTGVTDVAFAREVGADDFLEKPFKVRELIKRVTTLLKHIPPPATVEAGVSAPVSDAAQTEAATKRAQAEATPFDNNKSVPKGAGEVARD